MSGIEKLEYEGNVKNMLLDPVLDVKNQRSEFRLDNDDSGRVLLSSLRLSAIGVSCAGTPHYNYVAGVAGIIKNIFLMDGNVVLDKCINANGYMAFKNYIGLNDDKASKEKPLYRHNMGYMVDGFSPQDDVLTATDAPRSDVLYRSANGTIQNVADGLKFAGYIDLKMLLPMLGSVDVLPLSVFPRLRIVIEYESDPNKFLSDDTNPSTTIRPILSFDELTDMEEKMQATSSFGSASWLSIEHDQVFVPSQTGGGVNNRFNQTVNANVKNFRGKYLQKMVVAKNATDTAVFKDGNNISPMGANASVTSIDEKMNVKINGSPKLPLDCDRPNKRLALLQETWGLTNSYPLGSDHGSDRNYFILAQFDGASTRDKQVAVQDYFGVSVEDEIRDMELKFSRTCEGTGTTGNAQYVSALNLNMWGLCRKSLVMGSGGYRVMYN
jgi:hypothetical protein